MANRSSVRHQTKHSSSTPYNGMKKSDGVFPCPDVGHRGPPLEPDLEVGLTGEYLVARPIPIRPCL